VLLAPQVPLQLPNHTQVTFSFLPCFVNKYSDAWISLWKEIRHTFFGPCIFHTLRKGGWIFHGESRKRGNGDFQVTVAGFIAHMISKWLLKCLRFMSVRLETSHIEKCTCFGLEVATGTNRRMSLIFLVKSTNDNIKKQKRFFGRCRGCNHHRPVTRIDKVPCTFVFQWYHILSSAIRLPFVLNWLTTRLSAPWSLKALVLYWRFFISLKFVTAVKYFIYSFLLFGLPLCTSNIQILTNYCFYREMNIVETTWFYVSGQTLYSYNALNIRTNSNVSFENIWNASKSCQEVIKVFLWLKSNPFQFDKKINLKFLALRQYSKRAKIVHRVNVHRVENTQFGSTRMFWHQFFSSLKMQIFCRSLGRKHNVLIGTRVRFVSQEGIKGNEIMHVAACHPKWMLGTKRFILPGIG